MPLTLREQDASLLTRDCAARRRDDHACRTTCWVYEQPVFDCWQRLKLATVTESTPAVARLLL